MKTTLCNLMIFLVLFITCESSYQDPDPIVIRYTYFSGMRAVPDDSTQTHYNYFFPSGEFVHKKEIENKLVIKHSINAGTAFYDSLKRIIDNDDFNGMRNSYYRTSVDYKDGSRFLYLKQESFSKEIKISHMWADSLPAALWEIENMIYRKIKEIDSTDQFGGIDYYYHPERY